MKINKNLTDTENIKIFSENHNKHKIILKTYGKPHNESACIFEARLTRYELKMICDFITHNFINNNKK